MNCSFYVDEKEVSLKNASRPVLSIQSKGHVVHAFLNKELQGPQYEWVGVGITSVKIRALISGTVDLSGSTWEHKATTLVIIATGLLPDFHLQIERNNGFVAATGFTLEQSFFV
ncbi:hypothetical protein Droror1_Dr00023567 [Drosera rotundifolia]